MKLSLSKLILALILILIVVVSAISFIVLNRSDKSFGEAEKELALTTILGRKPNLKDAPTGSVLYNGKYASFYYPARAKIYQATSKQMLEAFSFDIDNPRLIYNFSVVDNKVGIKDVSEISDVILRKDKSRGYAESQISIGNGKALVFSIAGQSPEKTAFLLIKDKIYTISITGSDYDEIINLFDEIVTTFKLK